MGDKTFYHPTLLLMVVLECFLVTDFIHSKLYNFITEP